MQAKVDTRIENSILKTLAYFDIFNYPLLVQEIKQFSPKPIEENDLNISLNFLVSSGCIYKLNEFYSLRNDISLATKRCLGNERAGVILPKAFKVGAFLYKFPYVRAIAISGSLSKNFADEKGDIDFFIVTKADRLWIARTLMHLFKKFTYITGRQHLYCMNYYVDEACLEIQEKNIYTAVEIKTLMPAAGTLQPFFERNEWADQILPGFSILKEKKSHRTSRLKKFIEWLFNGSIGDKIDNHLLRITTRRWLRKENSGKKNMKGEVMNLLTSKHYARSNPNFYQERIIERYELKIAEMKNNWPEFF